MMFLIINQLLFYISLEKSWNDEFSIIFTLMCQFTASSVQTNQALSLETLLLISKDIGKSQDSGKEVRAVFFDTSKAFDRVWHKGLLFKIKQAEVDEKLPVWFSSYLTGREQRVMKLSGLSYQTTSLKKN